MYNIRVFSFKLLPVFTITKLLVCIPIINVYSLPLLANPPTNLNRLSFPVLAMSTSSLFSSLGAAFHAFPTSPFHSRTSNVSMKRNPVVSAFDTELAAQLERLKLEDEASCLNLHWLCHALNVVLSTHSNIEPLVPDFQHALAHGKIKWLDDYLEENVKLLDICNLLRETVCDIRNYRTFIELVLHSLEKGSLTQAQLRRAKNALGKCTEALRRKDGSDFCQQGQRRSKLETCSSTLRRMGEKLNVDDASKGNFFSAVYAAQVTTIFICSVLTAALCFKPRRTFCTMAIAGQCPWAFSLTSLQQRVKDQVDKRKAKGPAVLLEELEKTDIAIRSLQELVDKALVRNSLPLRKEEEQEFRQAIANLRKWGDRMMEGLNPLEQRINDLFSVLITSRMVLLDICSHPWRRKI